MNRLSPLARHNLERLAKRSLEANIVDTLEGKALRAGGHQFSSLWTRDFCFAVPGLVAIDRAEVAQNHLRMLLASVRPDGAVPRILDEGRSAFRVLRWTVGRRIFPTATPAGTITRPLRREYLGEHRTIAFDSGALLFLATEAAAWEWTEAEDAARQRILAFFERQTRGFTTALTQPAYSDWQDSARRQGSVDFVHYLVLRMLRLARQKNWVSAAQVASFEEVFTTEFFAGPNSPPEDLHSVRRGDRQISLETHLFRIQDLLQNGQRDAAQALWLRLKDHALYHRSIIPGIPVDPESSETEISFFTRSVGLRHYHDRLCWTWLAAETAKTAVAIGEQAEAERIFKHLHEVVESVGEVPEVLDPRTLRPFQSGFYESERPFSWGAAKICEALAALTKSLTPVEQMTESPALRNN